MRLLLQTHTRATVFALLGVEKDNACAFERASNRFGIGLGAALGPTRTLHALDRLDGELRRFRQILLAPVDKPARCSDLSRSQQLSPLV